MTGRLASIVSQSWMELDENPDIFVTSGLPSTKKNSFAFDQNIKEIFIWYSLREYSR
jgi:hypothetical protein